MGILHIFNPEHDLALASNLSNFTAPHAGRQLRADLGFLPAIWAGTGDLVLVENAEDAQTAFARLMHKSFDGFVEKRQLAHCNIDHIEPWGWDLALRAFLLRYGVAEYLLPTEAEIANIRDFSHRKHAVWLLGQLRLEGTTGESCRADLIAELKQLMKHWGTVVVKAPWSSSGRGVRFVDDSHFEQHLGWYRNIIQQQGSVVIEPYYNKVKDFGMEFEVDGEGHVTYCGLSLFHTSNGAYTGNVIAAEEEKREMISRYISLDLLDDIRQKIETLLGAHYENKYRGALGVDMMIVARPDANGFLLHPCVEINLRRTMGHVALALSKLLPSQQVMNIDYMDNHYKLKINRL